MNHFEKIKQNGIHMPMDNTIIGIDESKYLERHILIYAGKYYVVYDIIDNYREHVYYWDYESYNTIYAAEIGYEKLQDLSLFVVAD